MIKHLSKISLSVNNHKRNDVLFLIPVYRKNILDCFEYTYLTNTYQHACLLPYLLVCVIFWLFCHLTAGDKITLF